MSKLGNIKKIIEEASPEEVGKILRALKGESDDAVAKLGQGKNLEALRKAKMDAPSIEAPAYPANKGVTPKGDFELVGEPQTKDFTMVPEGSQVPAVRGNTIPEAVTPEIVEDVPMLPAVRKNTLPENIIDAQTTKPSSMLNKLLATGGAVGAGALMLGGGDEPPSIPLAPQDTPKQPMAAKPQQAPVAAPVQKQPAGEPKMADLASKLKDSYGPEGEAAAKTPEQEEMDYVKMMQEAQARQGDLDFIDNMLRAGITAGSAIGNTKADYSGVEALQKQNTRGVENVKGLMTADQDAKKLKKVQMELEDDKKLRDPKSDVSKMFRDAMAKAGFGVAETTSAQDGKNMGVNVFNILSQQIAREEARLNREMTMGNMNTERTKSSVDRGVQNWQKSDAAKAYNNAKTAVEAIDDALLSGNKIAAGTAFMAYGKVAQRDDSVLKSEDMKTLLGGTDYTPTAYAAKMKDLAVGKNVTDKELKAMRNIMQKIADKERTKAYTSLKPILNRAQSANLDLNEYIDEGKVSELSSGMENAIEAQAARNAGNAVNKAASGMVRVVRLSDGASKMMTAEQAAKADPSKYRVEK